MSRAGEKQESRSYAKALQDATHRYEKLVQDLSILRQMDATADPTADLEDVCKNLVQAIAFGLASENCSLTLVGTEPGVLELRAACSPFENEGVTFDQGSWSGRTFKFGEGIVGTVAQTGEGVRIEDVTKDERFSGGGDGPVRVHSLMCFPLKNGNDMLGVLNLSHSKPGFFTIESEHTMELVAERSASILGARILHERMRQSDEHYRLVTENSVDGILVFGTRGNIVSANKAIERITGSPTSRFVEGFQHWDAGIHPDDRRKFMAHRSDLITKRLPASIEYRYLDSSGETHRLEQRSAPMRDANGEVTGFVCSVRDLTDLNAESGTLGAPGLDAEKSIRLEESLLKVLQAADLAAVELRSSPAGSEYMRNAVRAAKEAMALCKDSALEPAGSCAQEDPVRRSARNGPGSVLVVEDEKLFMLLIENALVKQGYTVIKAENADDGLRLFDEHSEDLAGVVLDAVLPDANGASLFDTIREQDDDLPVLVTVGFTELPEAKLPDSRLTSGLVEKPFRQSDLAALIVSAFNG